MIVTPNSPTKKVTARGVTITLDEFEAGFLRTVLLHFSTDRQEGFAAKLFKELNQYYFPAYEKGYPNWENWPRGTQAWRRG